jgi:superfamily II DNA/RNA helicase
LLLQEPPAKKRPRLLILTPTRELALQIHENVRQFCRGTPLRYYSVTGGSPYPPQIRALKSDLDILISTPGRLLDHMQNGIADLSQVNILILDEADRMLDMGFIGDVNQIASATAKPRQTLLFSATFDQAVQKVARALLTAPLRIQLTQASDKHEHIQQRIHLADDFRHKRQLLRRLLSDPDITLCVIFTATKRSATDLAQQLREEGEKCGALHGDMKQPARRHTVEMLKRRKIRCLVATDVAARGLDVHQLSHVINFDLPGIAEDYIHRIGRTGRAGANGIAISLVGPQDWPYLASIEKLLQRKLERQVIEGLEPRAGEPKDYWRKPSQLKNQLSHKVKQAPVIKHKRRVGVGKIAGKRPVSESEY